MTVTKTDEWGSEVSKILLSRLDSGEIHVNFDDEFEFNLVNIGIDAGADAMLKVVCQKLRNEQVLPEQRIAELFGMNSFEI